MNIKLSKKHGVNPTMLQCLLCAGDSGIALLGRLSEDAEAPRRMVDQQPCDKCNEYMEMGFLIIVCKDGGDQENPYRTGEIQVIKLEVAEKMGIYRGRGRYAFIEESMAREMGMPKPTNEEQEE